MELYEIDPLTNAAFGQTDGAALDSADIGSAAEFLNIPTNRGFDAADPAAERRMASVDPMNGGGPLPRKEEL